MFERGGRNIGTQFAEDRPAQSRPASIQRLEEPGRPDLRQSNRGPGTGLRVAIPVLNIHKTRLNDPFMWFMGTNDQPGDYRHSGCAGCHVVYANDREPRHSLTYAQYGRDGQTATVDPTIASLRQGQHRVGAGPEEAHLPDGGARRSTAARRMARPKQATARRTPVTPRRMRTMPRSARAATRSATSSPARSRPRSA